jgi:thiamine pyrophosphate-dependent acetolactate synthase large subunit-like protein
MGGAAMIGLGIALAQPERPVLVVTGDGEMLMGIGSLLTIAVQQPKNLSLVVLDNERYGETGMQQTHTAYGSDLTAIAAGAGIRDSRTVKTEDEVRALRPALYKREGPLFATVKVDPEKLPLVLPPSEGAVLKNRFRQAVLGREALYA